MWNEADGVALGERRQALDGEVAEGSVISWK